MFQPRNISSTNQAVFGAVTNVEPYIQALLNPKQQFSKDELIFWDTTVRPAIYQSNANLLSVAKSFQLFFPNLLEWAGDLNNPTNIANFTQSLNTLLYNISSGVAGAKNLVQLLDSWSQKIEESVSVVASELAQLEQKIGSSELAQAVDAITSASGIMAASLADIAQRVVTENIGGIVIAVGQLAKAGNTSISTGGLVVAGGSISIVSDTTSFQQNLSLRAKATQRLAAASAEFAQLKSVAVELDSITQISKKLKDVTNTYSSSWLALQKELEETLASFQSVGTIQAQLKEGQLQWQQVINDIGRITRQVINIPVKVDTDHSYHTTSTLRTVRLATPIVQDINPTATRELLATEPTAGEAVQSLVTLIGNLKTDTKSFNATVDTEGLQAQSLQVVDQINTLIPELQALGQTLPDQLSALIQKTPLDVNAVKALFSNALTSSAPVQKDTASLLSSAGSLFTNATKAVSDTTAQVQSLTSQITSDQSQIDQLNSEIQALDIGISTTEQVEQYFCSGIFAVFCPVTDDLANLITDESAKEDALTAAQNTLASLNNSLSTAQAQKTTAQQFNTSAQCLVNDVNKLTQILEVITTNFNSVATAASADIVQDWVTAQAQDLISALRNLVGSSTLTAAPPRPARTRSSQVFLNLVSASLAPQRKVKAASLKVTAPSAPPTLLDTLSAINTALAITFSTSQTLAGQPNLAIASVPQFATRSALASDHAGQFASDYQDDILDVFTQVYALSSFSVTLLQKVTSLVASGSYDSALSVVARIQRELLRNRDITTGHAHDLNGFYGLLYRDAANLRVLGARNFTNIDEGAQEISKRLDSLQSQIAQENLSVTGGASSTILKAIEEHQTPPNITLRASPVAFKVGDLSLFAANVLNSSNGRDRPQAEIIDALSSTSSQLAKANADFTLFQTVFTQVQQILTASKDAVKQLENLAVALEGESTSLDSLAAQLQARTAQDLASTLQHWQTVQGTAQQFLQFATNFAL